MRHFLGFAGKGGVALAALLCAVGITSAQDQFEDPAPPPGTPYVFYPPVHWTTSIASSSAHGLSIGDIGGVVAGSPKDNWLDVVVVDRGLPAGIPPLPPFFAVLRNTGVWSVPPNVSGLAPATLIPFPAAVAGQLPYAVWLQDMDNDQDLDAVVTMQRTNEQPPAVVIFRNAGGGVFNTADTVLVGIGALSEAYGVCAADFDEAGNGLPDIAVAGWDYADGCVDPRPIVVLLRQISAYAFTEQQFVLQDDDENGPCCASATDVFPSRLVTGPNVPTWRRDIAVAIARTPDMVCDQGDALNCSVVQRVGAILHNPNTGALFQQVRTGADAYGISCGPVKVWNSFNDAMSSEYCVDDGSSGVAYFNEVVGGNATGNLQLQGNAPSLGASKSRGVSLGTINIGVNLDAAYACESGGPWGAGCVAILYDYTTGIGFKVVKRFNLHPYSPVAPQPKFVKVADMNRDGCRDVIATSSGLNDLTVLVRRCTTPGGSYDSSEGGGGEERTEEQKQSEGSDGPGWDDTEGPF